MDGVAAVDILGQGDVENEAEDQGRGGHWNEGSGISSEFTTRIGTTGVVGATGLGTGTATGAEAGSEKKTTEEHLGATEEEKQVA